MTLWYSMVLFHAGGSRECDDVICCLVGLRFLGCFLTARIVLNRKMARRPAIGIDLGTSYSCVAVLQNGKVEVIPNDEGSKITPSYVAFKDSKRLIGDSAKRHSNINPCNTVFGAKKLIGKYFDDQSVQRDMKHWPFSIVPTKDKRPVIQMDYQGESKTFYPEEISSMILSKMKDIAEMHLGQTVTDAVVTVPAYFSDAQRRATKDACTIAGLNVHRIISEPTAAAIAYGMEDRGQKEFNILVFDLGGGFCSVSILTLEDGIFETKATAGDTHLGGEDFDNMLVSYFAKEFEKEHRKDLYTSKVALRRLRTACEEAKKSLSSRTQANIEIEYLFEGINFCSSITRSKFEELNADLFKRTVELVEKVLHDAKLDKAQIHDIVLVGGSTRIPKVQDLLQAFFDGKHLTRSIHPDEAVASGAAIQAAILNGDRSKEIQGLLLLDTIPYSLGIGTSTGEMCFVIKKDTTIPTRQFKEFSTQFDNQSAVLLKVYEGESEKAEANNLLGQFELNGISQTREGKADIEVCFDVDANGIFSVSAVDKSTEKASRITINDKGRLPQVEIERMVRDAKKYKDEEDKQKSRISSRTALENYAWNARSAVADDNLENWIPEDDKNKILDKTNDTLAWLQNTEFAEKEEYEQKHKELQHVCAPVLVKLNKNTDDAGMPDNENSFCCCN